MTKFILFMWLCSGVANDCQRIIIPYTTFDSYRECSLYGYQHTVDILTKDGCLITDSFGIIFDDCEYFFYTPNAFTPNNDGINDQFHFYDEMLSELYVHIYNRWGIKVYHWETPQGFWDGKGYNGELLPEGVYFFTMEATGENGNSYIEKGSITLIR